MSGGVDSSVAAALLVEQGVEVIGVTLRVWPWREPEEATPRSSGAAARPRRVDGRARGRAPPRHRVLPAQHRARVRARGDRAVRARLRGGAHAGAVRGLQPRGEVRLAGAARPRVGRGRGGHRPLRAHHARRGGGRFLLWRGRDARKDQSDFLWPLTPVAARGGALPGGRADQGGGAREGPRPRASRPRTSRRARRSASSPTTTTAASCAGGCRRPSPPGRSSTGRAPCSGGTRAWSTTRSASAAASACPRAGPLYVTALDPGRNALVVGEAARGRGRPAAGRAGQSDRGAGA